MRQYYAMGYKKEKTKEFFSNELMINKRNNSYTDNKNRY